MSPASAGSEVFTYSVPASWRDAMQQAHRDWDSSGNTGRLWKRDASLWTGSDEGEWLGWLDVIDRQLSDTSKFKALAAEVKEDGFTHLVLIGTGGTSRAGEFFRKAFGGKPGVKSKHNASPELLVLDSMDPLQIRELRARIDPGRTLFCVAGRTGDTVEASAAWQYFFHETKQTAGERAGHHFIAIAGEGSELERLAGRFEFRHVYRGDRNVSEPYAAFTDFGLVTNAAAGYDTERLLKRAKIAAEASKSDNSHDNPGVELGLILGTAAAKFNCNKATVICSRSLEGLGDWIEHLLAGFSGAPGGLIPIVGEPVLDSESYGPDRIFIYIKNGHDGDRLLDEKIAELEQSGHAVIRMLLEDLNDVSQTMFQWQIAAAVAGSLAGVNPFRQSDFAANDAEQATETPILAGDEIKLFADAENAAAILKNGESLGGVIRHHLDRLNPGDCFGLSAYIPRCPEHEEAVQQIRKQIVESKQVATLADFGFREHESPALGVFLQITCDDADDLQVPERNYTFGMLKAAEARAAFGVLEKRKRRALRVHLSSDVSKGLSRLRNLICAAVEH